MRKQLFCLSLSSALFSSLNAVSNSDLLNMGYELSSPLQRFKDSFTSILASEVISSFEGLHNINDDGWYVTTNTIAQDIKECKEKYDFFVRNHESLDLALVKIGNNDRTIDSQSYLSKIAAPEIFSEYRWVLSLSNVHKMFLNSDLELNKKLLSYVFYSHNDQSDYRELYNAFLEIDFPLMAVSCISGQENNDLLLDKGNINDFYSTSRAFYTKKRLNEIDSELNQKDIEIQKVSLLEVKENVIKKLFYKLNQSMARLNDLMEARKNVKRSRCHLKKATRILENDDDNELRIYRKNISESQTKMFDSIKSKVDKQKIEIEEYKIKMNYYKKISLDDSKLIQKWQSDMKDLEDQILVLIKEKEILEQGGYTNENVNSFWEFETTACNGVADKNDIGGGIYSYPINQNDYSSYQLIGMTVSVEKEGETSRAINLTTPEIKSWMNNIIHQYYEAIKENSNTIRNKRSSEVAFLSSSNKKDKDDALYK